MTTQCQAENTTAFTSSYKLVKSVQCNHEAKYLVPNIGGGKTPMCGIHLRKIGRTPQSQDVEKIVEEPSR